MEAAEKKRPAAGCGGREGVDFNVSLGERRGWGSSELRALADL